MSTAQLPSPTSIFQEMAVVVETDPSLRVRSASGTFTARRAASCMLAPACGDHVLIAVPQRGDLYVLAILERDSTEETHLELEGNVRLSCDGELTLMSAKSVQVKGAEEVLIASRTVRTSAIDAEIVADEINIVSRAVFANAKILKNVIKVVDTVAERISLRTKSAYRFVDGLDSTRAGNLDLRAETTASVRGQNAFVSAEELVKVQAEQIHLG